MIKNMNKLTVAILGLISASSLKTNAQVNNEKASTNKDKTANFIRFLAKNNALTIKDGNHILVDEKAILKIIRQSVADANNTINMNEINIDEILKELEVNKYDQLQKNSEAFKSMSFDRNK